jgi:hypothetical protein
MGEPELLLLMLMLAVGGLGVLAGAVRVPYPIVLVLGGLAYLGMLFYSMIKFGVTDLG